VVEPRPEKRLIAHHVPGVQQVSAVPLRLDVRCALSFERLSLPLVEVRQRDERQSTEPLRLPQRRFDRDDRAVADTDAIDLRRAERRQGSGHNAGLCGDDRRPTRERCIRRTVTRQIERDHRASADEAVGRLDKRP